MSAAKQDSRLDHADTVGVAFDFQSPAAQILMRRKLIKNRDALAALKEFRRAGMRYGVVAGELHREHSGAFAAGALAADGLVMAVLVANARLAEGESKATAWWILTDHEIEKAITTALAEASECVGGMQ